MQRYLLILGCVAVFVQAQQTPEKLRKYLESEMWPEATDYLRTAVKADEFNADLRFALGETLFKTGEYDQAVTQFALSKKLNAGLWQAGERLADTHLKLWESKGSVSERLAACKSYQDVSGFHSETGTASSEAIALLFAQPNDLPSAKRRSLAAVAKLSSPLGHWRTEDGRAYTVHEGERLWSLDSPAHDSWFFFEIQPGGKLSGDGYHTTGSCMLKLSVEIQVVDCGTRMRVDGIPTGEAVVSPSEVTNRKSLQEIRALSKACAEALGVLKGRRAFRLDLTRMP